MDFHPYKVYNTQTYTQKYSIPLKHGKFEKRLTLARETLTSFSIRQVLFRLETTKNSKTKQIWQMKALETLTSGRLRAPKNFRPI